MGEYFVDVRFLVSADNISRAPQKLEPIENLVLNDGDIIKEFAVMQVKLRKDDFHD
ncbi:hypothetical protein [uncultured Methanobrevibacter sp.]|uniref:hypothetical protein n=1 Tax=uncultured Methanobrevibacter sp. TaxID=253161 RepID=UPI0025D86B61|nr:hypothetical protein [uncultured Methanobrevibacter sp.]